MDQITRNTFDVGYQIMMDIQVAKENEQIEISQNMR